MSNIPFKIYNASAGSGKTYVLVKTYLTLLLQNPEKDIFKHVLAITFTNKAVNEMKERIIKNLKNITPPSNTNTSTELSDSLSEVLQITPEILQDRASKVLKRILHNYAFFDVITIDKFNHRLLRAFAYDLKLPMNFDVALDVELLLQEAVDNLIYTAGEDDAVTQILVDYAIEKTDDDKSWDIAYDLNKVAKLLLEENHNEHIEQLKNYSLSDFIQLKKLLQNAIQKQITILKKQARNVLDLITNNLLEPSDFSRETLPNHFKKIAAGDFNGLYNNLLEENLLQGKIYPKSTPEEKAVIIDRIIPQLIEHYQTMKKGVYQLKFLQNFYKNCVPLTLLNAIQNELDTIKADQNILLISEFNAILSNVIVNEPAPFIYERIGEKYRHYFIDEFQDTSEMQWKNLIPLIGNALEGEISSGERGSLLIVGDAKQAIYRWRGGKAEQFIDLYNCNNPFQTEKEVTSLPINYRSKDEIVQFNNSFFQHISQFLTNDNYKDLYLNKSTQKTNGNPGGYIHIDFIDPLIVSDKKEMLQQYVETVITHIQQLIDDGYQYSDICILTRKKKHGLIVADFLSKNQVPIISSESLLLKNSPKIDFLIQLILYSLQPENKETQMSLLHFIAMKKQIDDKDAFFKTFLDNLEQLFLDYSFRTALFMRLSLLDALEYTINCFELSDESDAYLQYFLDEVLDFSFKNHSSFTDFIAYWEKKKDTLSIVSPQETNAVQIMTIHKAKGLEFSVVIYPFADTYIYEEQDPKIWLPVEKEQWGIDNALFSKNKDFSFFNNSAKTLYEDAQSKLELDQINILYVALTRAVERLYIISKKDIKRNGEENTNTFSGLFINYLKVKALWNDEKLHYSIGKKLNKSTLTSRTHNTIIPFISNQSGESPFKIVTKSGSLWAASKEKTIEKGNVYHLLLSQIIYAEDVSVIIEKNVLNGTLATEDKITIASNLKNIVTHPELKVYFSANYTIHNEREIFTADGIILRPDRLVFDDKHNNVIIIDYKTGSHHISHEEQIQRYGSILKEIGFKVTAKILVYINESIHVQKL
ncbi:UvrD-helicase domain-containing protein [Leptobacterium sp. I13]|uniref:UvrD-helicase domain-containing protein n=1 Tax=Leptobacterium meishanense TaxID=3128904 RepID=UPI0030EBF057